MENRFSSLIYDVRFIIIFGAGIRILLSMLTVGTFHPDETFQSTELAFYIIDDRPNQILAWEIGEQVRSYLWPVILSIFIYVLLLIGIRGILLFQLLRIIFSLISLIVIPVIGSFFDDGTAKGKRRTVLVSWVIVLFPPFVLLSIMLTTDNLATTFLLVSIFFKPSNSRRLRMFHGGLNGFTIALRLQYSIFFIVIGMKRLFSDPDYLWLIGIIIGFLPNLLSDLIFYGTPGITIWNFLKFNVIDQSNAKFFGSRPWWYYLLGVLIFVYGPIGVAFLYMVKKESYQFIVNSHLKDYFLGSLLYFVIFQSLDYKEIRFMYILLQLFAIAGIVGFIDLHANSLMSISLRRIKITKLLLSLLIISSVVTLFITPYDLRGNLWRAQDHARNIDPNGNITITSRWLLSGGYLLQSPDNSESVIHFVEDFDEIGAGIALNNSNLVILDLDSTNYKFMINQINLSCDFPSLVKIFDDFRPFTLIHQIRVTFGFVQAHNVELWQCHNFAN